MGDQRLNAARWLSSRAATSESSLIQDISRLAQKHNAINLAEGFPDYPAPAFLKEAGIAAIQSDFNQYRYASSLCEAIARQANAAHELAIDPTTEVTLAIGQTGAFASAILAVIDAGDEVLIFDPAYETYGACVRLAGGVPKYVALTPPYWQISRDKVEAEIGARTKAIVINSPCNPTGRVLSRTELEIIADLCVTHDLLAITDEVYEHFSYDKEAPHVSVAALPAMRERTIVTSSISKTFGVTGWRIGWAIAPPPLATAIVNIQTKLADSAPAPFQEAALVALSSRLEYYEQLRKEYKEKCRMTVAFLEAAGLEVPMQPEGGFFVFARLPPSYRGTDVQYTKELIQNAGVAIVPGSNFFHNVTGSQTRQNVDDRVRDQSTEPLFSKTGLESPTLPDIETNANGSLPSTGCADVDNHYHERYVRVAFCKSLKTLEAASEALEKFSRSR
eukprot:TRINITY_DN21897_c0_g1_i1.p1 TRINITY_DN21897_c0_g1~~TRINITY_DN21897_c0_g1_i1.p1  ORF type:complete len:448 (-),score=54.80 TRINITY_DN21897_c0_g1_i1:50-1393(-)